MAYKIFDNFLLRAPLFPLDFYYEMIKGNYVHSDSLRKLLITHPEIQEALFIASPSFFEQVKKFLDYEVNKEKENKISESLLKYFSRMSSRCTPYGLFAGTAIGEFSDLTDTRLKKRSKYKRHTRLDMEYLVKLSFNLAGNKIIREKIKFFPNSSIYTVGESLRYIVYSYKNNKRVHEVVQVQKDCYLELILNNSYEGATISDLTLKLNEQSFTSSEAREYINLLIDSQFLKSDLEPAINGPEFLSQILTVLEDLGSDTTELTTPLKEFDKKISDLDKSLSNDLNEYFKLMKDLKQFLPDYEGKNLFQTDLKLNVYSNTINKSHKKSILKTLTFFNKISSEPSDSKLSRFREEFRKRYGDKEMPLGIVLDPELGLGYSTEIGGGDVNTLIDDLNFPSPETNSTRKLEVNNFHAILSKKLEICLKNSDYTIKFSDDDLNDLSTDWEGFPKTFSAIIEIVCVKGEETVVMTGAGGASGANLLSRFSHSDLQVKEHSEKIIEKERSLNSGKIIAEVGHLPQARVGNILSRPILRKYEIPYLAKSLLKKENQLDIDDLVISVNQAGNIILKSLRLNAEVLPRITNAHNFHGRNLPLYQFLGDLQITKGRNSLGFNWGPLLNDFQFLPRVVFENVIVHPASWRVEQALILKWQKLGDEQLLLETQTWRKFNKIPHQVLLIEGDNELLIDFRNISSIRMLLNTVKTKHHFYINEFLFHKNSNVKTAKSFFTNQFIITFYN